MASARLATTLGPLPLPALPSNTKGPASFLGVVGPSAPSISNGHGVVAPCVDDASAVGASLDGGCEVVGLDSLEGKEFRASMSKVALGTSPGRGGAVREPIRRTRRLVAGAGAAVCSSEFGRFDKLGGLASGLIRFAIERSLVVIVESTSSSSDASWLSSSFDSASIASSPLTAGTSLGSEASSSSASRHSSPAGGSSTSASRSATARQLGQRNCGQVFWSLRIGRMHL